MSILIDTLIAIALTQSILIAHAPTAVHESAPSLERSVWAGYTGLYKLQGASESCSRKGSCPGLKPQLTWAPVLLNTKLLTNHKEK